MLKKLAFVCLVLALSMPAYAMTVVYNSGTGSGGDWRLDNNGHAPLYTTAALTQTSMVTGENNAGGYADGQMMGLGQQFSNLTSNELDIKAISIKVNSMSNADYHIKMYDLGPASNYTAITPDPMNLSSSTPDFDYAFTTSGVTTQQIISFNLTDAQTEAIYAGEKYAFVITETHQGSSDGLIWIRGNPQTANAMGVTTNGGGGGANIWKNIRDYGGSPQTDTTSTRDFTLALYCCNVPEPATMALLGLGGLVLLRRRK